jgi:hypothetical protein
MLCLLSTVIRYIQIIKPSFNSFNYPVILSCKGAPTVRGLSEAETSRAFGANDDDDDSILSKSKIWRCFELAV